MSKYVVRDAKTFAEQRKLLEKTIPRLPEALKGLEWALSRKPYLFDKIERVSGLRAAKLEALQESGTAHTYTVTVFFKLLSESEVELQWMDVHSSREDAL